MDGKRVELRVRPAVLAGKFQHQDDHCIFSRSCGLLSFVEVVKSFHTSKQHRVGFTCRWIRLSAFPSASHLVR